MDNKIKEEIKDYVEMVLKSPTYNPSSSERIDEYRKLRLETRKEIVKTIFLKEMVETVVGYNSSFISDCKLNDGRMFLDVISDFCKECENKDSFLYYIDNTRNGFDKKSIHGENFKKDLLNNSEDVVLNKDDFYLDLLSYYKEPSAKKILSQSSFFENNFKKMLSISDLLKDMRSNKGLKDSIQKSSYEEIMKVLGLVRPKIMSDYLDSVMQYYEKDYKYKSKESYSRFLSFALDVREYGKNKEIEKYLELLLSEKYIKDYKKQCNVLFHILYDTLMSGESFKRKPEINATDNDRFIGSLVSKIVSFKDLENDYIHCRVEGGKDLISVNDEEKIEKLMNERLNEVSSDVDARDSIRVGFNLNVKEIAIGAVLKGLAINPHQYEENGCVYPLSLTKELFQESNFYLEVINYLFNSETPNENKDLEDGVKYLLSDQNYLVEKAINETFPEFKYTLEYVGAGDKVCFSVELSSMDDFKIIKGVLLDVLKLGIKRVIQYEKVMPPKLDEYLMKRDLRNLEKENNLNIPLRSKLKKF